MKEIIRTQRSFAVILAGRAGRERFRHTIMANDQEHAMEKATRMAKRLKAEVELVAPVENLPFTPITLPAVEREADEEPERGSDRGE